MEVMRVSDTDQSRLSDTEMEHWRQLVEKPHSELSDAEITSKIRLSLKRRLGYPEWVMVFEYAAPNGRRADAIALNTQGSRNYKIVGFEFKASRSDWLNELRDGQKAERFVRLCDEWYVVAGGTNIVKGSELPNGWGLFEMKPNSEQLWKMEDSDMTEYQQGEPDRQFFAQFLKKTVGGDANYTRSDLREARKRGYEDAKESMTKRYADREVKRLEDDAENWRALRDAGFDYIYRMNEEQIETLERAPRLVRSISGDSYGSLEGMLNMAESTIEREIGDMQSSIEEVRETIEEINSELDGGEWPERGGDEGAK